MSNPYKDIRDLMRKHGAKDAVPDDWKEPDVGRKTPEPTEQEAKDAIEAIEAHGLKPSGRDLPSGAFGEYMQLTANIGVKLLRHGKFKTREAAEGDKLWKSAEDEANNLKKARVLFGKMVPLFVYLGAIKMGSEYRIGLVVQHVNGKMISELSSWENPKTLLAGAQKEIEAKGYVHGDLHSNNAMLVREDDEEYVYVVDWGTAGIKL